MSMYPVNNINLHVVEKGSKEDKVIIFLHGFPEFWYGWKKQMDFFADKGFSVVVPDQRGYNLSSKPAGVKSYRIELLIADIAELITRLTSRKVMLVGHDWGGNVAWTMAMHYPQLLEKLIIINMPHPEVMRAHLQKNLQQMLRSWYAGFFQLPLLPEKIVQAFDFRILAGSMIGSAQPETFSDQDIAHYKQAWRQPGAIKSMIHWYRAYKYNSLDINEEIDIPTLLIWGQKDSFLHHKMASQSMGRCQEGRLEMIQDATHWVHHEKPQQVNALIYDFVR